MRYFIRIGRLAAAVAVLTLVAGTPAAADASPSLTSALRSDLQQYLAAQGQQDHVSAISLRVTYPGFRPAVAVSAGNPPRDTLWQIGSNTKAFTSVVLLQLEAEHRLSIDDPLGRWLPQYPAWRDVTIEQLLNMTSGIPDYVQQPAWLADIQADPGRNFSAESLLAYVADQPLGSGWSYSNANYLLAQLVIERATHDSYFRQVTRRILEPLGLHDTCFAPETCPSYIAPRIPVGYSMQAGLPALVGRPVPRLALSWAQGAGGLISSLQDMTTWDRALYSGSQLPPAQQRELQSLIPVAPDFSFGLGVAQRTSPAAGATWAYEGGTLGSRVFHMYVPGNRLIIAVAVNSSVDVDTLPELADTIYRTLSNLS